MDYIQNEMSEQTHKEVSTYIWLEKKIEHLVIWIEEVYFRRCSKLSPWACMSSSWVRKYSTSFKHQNICATYLSGRTPHFAPAHILAPAAIWCHLCLPDRCYLTSLAFVEPLLDLAHFVAAPRSLLAVRTTTAMVAPWKVDAVISSSSIWISPACWGGWCQTVRRR